MIEPVIQTEYQIEEAKTPGSLARRMVALLVRRERATYRELRSEVIMCEADPLRDKAWADSARTTWLEARRAAGVVQRILYGWEL